MNIKTLLLFATLFFSCVNLENSYAQSYTQDVSVYNVGYNEVIYVGVEGDVGPHGLPYPDGCSYYQSNPQCFYAIQFLDCNQGLVTYFTNPDPNSNYPYYFNSIQLSCNGFNRIDLGSQFTTIFVDIDPADTVIPYHLTYTGQGLTGRNNFNLDLYVIGYAYQDAYEFVSITVSEIVLQSNPPNPNDPQLLHDGIFNSSME